MPNKMKSYLEKLPVKLTVDGKEYWLRIKARDCEGKKWCIRYIGKYVDTKKARYSFKARVRGFTYKTLCQFWGNNLELLAKRVITNLRY